MFTRNPRIHRLPEPVETSENKAAIIINGLVFFGIIILVKVIFNAII